MINHIRDLLSSNVESVTRKFVYTTRYSSLGGGGGGGGGRERLRGGAHAEGLGTRLRPYQFNFMLFKPNNPPNRVGWIIIVT